MNQRKWLLLIILVLFVAAFFYFDLPMDCSNAGENKTLDTVDT